MSLYDKVWLITEEGLYKAIDVRKRIANMTQAELNAVAQASMTARASGEEQKEFKRDYMISRTGPLAVVSINGTLVNNDDPYNKYFGEVGYPEIRDAVMEAVENPEVKAILLDMNSPGGQVSGISETVDFLRMVDKDHKPIYSHASSSMASGGYWLGSVGRRISASELAVVGSIGVVTVHASYEKMYKDMGIELTVLRQGEFKALGNPYEKLSEKARAKIEEEMKVIYDTFLTQVSDARGMTVPRLKETAAEGRVFYGKQAVEVGLADAVESFDQVASTLIKKYSASSGANSINSGTGVDMKKRVLSEKGQAAIAAGVPEATVLADESLTTLVAEDATPAAPAAEPAQPAASGEPAPAAPQEPAAAATPAPAAQSGEGSAVVAELLKEVREANSSLAKLQVQLAESQSATMKMQASHDKLVKIAVAATQRMQVALGGSPMKMDGLDASVVVDQYHQVLSQFNSKFKVGAVAEVPGSEDTGAVAASQDQDSPVAKSAQKLTKF